MVVCYREGAGQHRRPLHSERGGGGRQPDVQKTGAALKSGGRTILIQEKESRFSRWGLAADKGLRRRGEGRQGGTAVPASKKKRGAGHEKRVIRQTRTLGDEDAEGLSDIMLVTAIKTWQEKQGIRNRRVGTKGKGLKYLKEKESWEGTGSNKTRGEVKDGRA